MVNRERCDILPMTKDSFVRRGSQWGVVAGMEGGMCVGPADVRVLGYGAGGVGGGEWGIPRDVTAMRAVGMPMIRVGRGPGGEGPTRRALDLREGEEKSMMWIWVSSACWLVMRRVVPIVIPKEGMA